MRRCFSHICVADARLGNGRIAARACEGFLETSQPINGGSKRCNGFGWVCENHPVADRLLAPLLRARPIKRPIGVAASLASGNLCSGGFLIGLSGI